MDEALGLWPEDHAVVGGEAEGHSSRRPRQVLRVGQGFRNKNVVGWVQKRTLQARIPGGSLGLLEETKISPFIPVLNLAVLPFLELSRELSLVRQKRPSRRLFLPRFPGNLLEGGAIVAGAGIPRGVILATKKRREYTVRHLGLVARSQTLPRPD